MCLLFSNLHEEMGLGGKFDLYYDMSKSDLIKELEEFAVS